MGRLSKAEQDQIVVDLAVGVESLDDDEFEELYDQLDVKHQIEVDQNLREFANGAVGSDTWDSDD